MNKIILNILFLFTLNSCVSQNNNMGNNSKLTTSSNKFKSVIDTANKSTTKIVNNDENNGSSEYEQNFKTRLKGGYVISYVSNEQEQLLFLKKGNQVVDTVGQADGNTRLLSLGHVESDFDKCFVIVQSFGSSENFFQLIDKKTGRIILNDGGYWLKGDDAKNVILYLHQSEDGFSFLVLYDVISNKGAKYVLPKLGENEDGVSVFKSIRLKKVNKDSFIITYNVNQITKKKQYKRT